MEGGKGTSENKTQNEGPMQRTWWGGGEVRWGEWSGSICVRSCLECIGFKEWTNKKQNGAHVTEMCQEKKRNNFNYSKIIKGGNEIITEAQNKSSSICIFSHSWPSWRALQREETENRVSTLHDRGGDAGPNYSINSTSTQSPSQLPLWWGGQIAGLNP